MKEGMGRVVKRQHFTVNWKGKQPRKRVGNRSLKEGNSSHHGMTKSQRKWIVYKRMNPARLERGRSLAKREDASQNVFNVSFEVERSL